jgi:GNAT acetyltransferase-like protein
MTPDDAHSPVRAALGPHGPHGGATGMTGTPETRLAHQNLISFNRALTRWSTRGALEEDEGAVLCAGGTWIPVVANGAFRSDDAFCGEELVARADAFFAGLARGFSVKVRDGGEDEDLRQACQDAGLDRFGDATPEMICTSRLPDRVPTGGLTLRWVEDEAGLADFVAVNAEAYGSYGMPPEVLHDLFDDAGQVLADEAAHIVVVRRDGAPVATAMTFESDGVASLQWVGTVPAARTGGLGALVTTLATNLAFDRGASSCSLQASPMGAPLYLALGYVTAWHYGDYVRWPRPPSGS